MLNIQPVIPFSLNEDWNLISRTILPVTWQNDIAGQSGTQFGLGDITQSFFFSPSKPTETGIVWGAGPVFLLPTATDELLGGGKWGAGPTAVVLKQDGPWTFSLNTESTYNWETNDWSVPINFAVAKLITIDKQPISLTAGIRYWADAPENGPEGLGFRVAVSSFFRSDRLASAAWSCPELIRDRFSHPTRAHSTAPTWSNSSGP
jgi:hypothetical protein